MTVKTRITFATLLPFESRPHCAPYCFQPAQVFDWVPADERRPAPAAASSAPRARGNARQEGRTQETDNRPTCKYFRQGTCRHGERCLKRHDRTELVNLKTLLLGARPSADIYIALQCFPARTLSGTVTRVSAITGSAEEVSAPGPSIRPLIQGNHVHVCQGELLVSCCCVQPSKCELARHGHQCQPRMARVVSMQARHVRISYLLRNPCLCIAVWHLRQERS